MHKILNASSALGFGTESMLANIKAVLNANIFSVNELEQLVS